MLWLVACTVDAQTIWDRAHLAEVKSNLQQPAYQQAYVQLLQEAELAVRQDCPSVMQKDQTAASGNKHDYLSLSRYFWPDPTKPDGLP